MPGRREELSRSGRAWGRGCDMHTISAKVLAWQYGSTKRVPDTTKLIWRYQVLKVEIHYPESCGYVLDVLVTGQRGTMSYSSVRVLFSNVVLCKDGLLAPRIELQGTCFTFVILDAERRKLCFLCILFTREDRCYPVGRICYYHSALQVPGV